MSSSRESTNELQAKLAKMGGGSKTRGKTAKKRSKATRMRRSQNRIKRNHSTKKRKNRKLRGGAVAPTTDGSSQGGSDTLYLAQQQALANRKFDDPNNA